MKQKRTRKGGEGVLPEVEFQHAGDVLPGGLVRGDVGFDPVEGRRKGLGDGGVEFWANDGDGGFDGAELGEKNTRVTVSGPARYKNMTQAERLWTGQISVSR